MTQLPQSNQSDVDDVDKRLAEAKEARKRAKEKARSMHARIFRKKDESNDAIKIKANTTSHRARVAQDGISSRPAFASPLKKVKKMRQGFKFGSSNSSMSSISEDEILSFHDSGNSSLSSLTQFTSSSSSLQGSLSGLVTQGPSHFENCESTTSGDAPKMPCRQANFAETNHGSSHSLSLEDIVDDSLHGREWSEKASPSAKGVNMPVRHDSIGDGSASVISDSSTSIQLSVGSLTGSGESSSAGVSFYSSASEADTFALHKAKARCSV